MNAPVSVAPDLSSGLVKAAREAVQQWVYRPTLLNGNPVEVVTQIDINFTLSENPPARAPAPNAQQ